ncbi:hypothetical protein QWY28_23105 [Nocardioides sp. SOB77]|uniref:Uncharacterized protein n=1 Tax=Nocardioides oceani TaxID=3058369 RepID=A0ABT8FMG7_9ACTN|nr:hypothetical protein [Nocardioides oceani]MDN4175864.1 hypothetical protein [Nocardioides oceani]
MQTFDQPGSTSDAVHGATEVPVEVKVLGQVAADLSWASQKVTVIADEHLPVSAGLAISSDQAQRRHEFMNVTLEASTVLFVPIGAGPTCLGTWR